MRKVFSLLLILSLLLTGCGKDKGDPKPDEEATEQEENTDNKEETQENTETAEESEEEQGPVTIKVAIQGDEASIMYQAFSAFKTTIEEAFPEEVLVELQTEASENVKDEVLKGDIGLAVINRNDLEKENKFLKMFDSWFLFLDFEHYRIVMRDKVGEVMFEKMSKNSKVKVFDTIYFDSKVINLRDVYDVKNVEDFYDVDFGVKTNDTAIAEAITLGANPVLYVPKNTYKYLVEKTINGYETNLEEIEDNRYYEITSTLVNSEHNYDFGFIVMNNDIWNKLDTPQKEMVKEAIKKVVEYSDSFTVSDRKDYLELFKDYGLEIDELDRKDFFYTFADFYRNNSEYTEDWNTEYYERILKLGINLMNEREEAAQKAEEEENNSGSWVISGE